VARGEFQQEFQPTRIQGPVPTRRAMRWMALRNR